MSSCRTREVRLDHATDDEIVSAVLHLVRKVGEMTGRLYEPPKDRMFRDPLHDETMRRFQLADHHLPGEKNKNGDYKTTRDAA